MVFRAHLAWLGPLLLFCSCAGGTAARTASVDPTIAVGRTHQGYHGKPVYLAAARPLPPSVTTQPEPPNPCRTRSDDCDDKLRAALAGLDLQVLALAAPATELQLRALELAARNLAPLLAPYPDLQPEADEVAKLATELPTHPAAEQGPIKKRLIELSDLLRVQVAAGQ
jgi:hypothetical protein